MIRVALCVVLISSVAFAADNSPPDWSAYVNHGEIAGVVVKAGLDEITIDIPVLKRNQQGNNNNRGRQGGRNRRPSMTVGHEHIEVSFAPSGLVRWEKLPMFPDGKGGQIRPTGKAFEDLKKPYGVIGYAADKTELRPGHIVLLQLVRPRTVPISKVTDSDVTIKYAIIKGETTPPKATEEPKKKKK
jgi:hypothetical protein